MADDYEEGVQRIIKKYNQGKNLLPLKLKSDSQEIAQDLTSQFPLQRFWDYEPDNAQDIVQELKKKLSDGEFGVYSNNKQLFTTTISPRVYRGGSHLDIQLDKTEGKRFDDAEFAKDVLESDKLSNKISNLLEKGVDINNLNEQLSALGINSITLKPVSQSSKNSEINNTMKTDDIKDFAMSKKGIAVAVAGVIGFMVLR